MNTAAAAAPTIKNPTFRSYYKAFKAGHLEQALQIATGVNKASLIADLRDACTRKAAAIAAARAGVTAEVYSEKLLRSGRTSNYCFPENGGRETANATKRPWALKIHDFPDVAKDGVPDQAKLAGKMTWAGEQHLRLLDIQALIDRFIK